MQILPLSKRLEKYLTAHQLKHQFDKQAKLFRQNPFHPSLNTEILEPRHLKIYSFRINQKYRAIFVYTGSGAIEIVDINNHYK
jgi:plasmid maintenance system killer protein